MKYLSFIYYIHILLSCNTPASTRLDKIGKHDSDLIQTSTTADDSSKFYPYKNDLYINKKGIIVYRAYDKTVPEDIIETFIYYVNNFDTIKSPAKREIHLVIDTASFKFLGDLYYRDKKYAYYHWPMMDGGFFSIIWEADCNTLKIFGKSWYAKDKNHIFCRGNVLKDADYKTFTIIPLIMEGDTSGWLGKDKNNIYDVDRKLDEKSIKDWNLKM